MYADLTIFGLFIFFYSAVAGGVERTPITGPIVFTALAQHKPRGNWRLN